MAIGALNPMVFRPHRLALLVAAAALLGFAWLGATPAAAHQPRLAARAWALIDARDGRVLASHAGRRRLPIASTTKLMTAYVALRELPLSHVVRAAPYDAEYGESLLGLRPGQRIDVRDLLYGLVLRSGNDAAYDLALAAAGTERRFVHRMNATARELGLSDTHYANPIGLDQRGNHSSARDLTSLTRRLLRIPVFARIAAARHAVLRSVHPRRRISSVNELLRMAPWVNGVKTGHTVDAGYVLVGSGRRRGLELISAVLGARSDEARFRGALRLLRYGFSHDRRRRRVHASRAVPRPGAGAPNRPRGFLAAHAAPAIAVAAIALLFAIAFLWRLPRRGPKRQNGAVSFRERGAVSRRGGRGGVAR